MSNMCVYFNQEEIEQLLEEIEEKKLVVIAETCRWGSLRSYLKQNVPSYVNNLTFIETRTLTEFNLFNEHTVYVTYHEYDGSCTFDCKLDLDAFCLFSVESSRLLTKATFSNWDQLLIMKPLIDSCLEFVQMAPRICKFVLNMDDWPNERWIDLQHFYWVMWTWREILKRDVRFLIWQKMLE